METNHSADLRRRERVPVAIPVGLAAKAGEWKADTAASTLNVSLSGVRVRTKLALVPEQPVKIVIEGQFSRTLAGRVVWVRGHKPGHWRIAGIKFAA